MILNTRKTSESKLRFYIESSLLFSFLILLLLFMNFLASCILLKYIYLLLHTKFIVISRFFYVTRYSIEEEKDLWQEKLCTKKKKKSSLKCFILFEKFELSFCNKYRFENDLRELRLLKRFFFAVWNNIFDFSLIVIFFSFFL